jgi:hypothetical protein
MLRLFEVILDKKELSKAEILSQFDISEISFKRYLGCLREYLYYTHPTWRIAFRRSKGIYELEQQGSL